MKTKRDVILREEEKVYKKMIGYRKKLALQYLEVSATMPDSNDEEADKIVAKLAGAVGHFRTIKKLDPKVASELVEPEKKAIAELAAAYGHRGDLYRAKADVVRKTHLDRGVATLEKTLQDYELAIDMNYNKSTYESKKAKTNKVLTKWRLELAEENSQEGFDEDEFTESGEQLEIDLSEKRDMVLEDDPLRGYENDQNMPDPIDNY